MLYVVTNVLEKTWHVGSTVPELNVQDVVEIQADGAELDWIRENVSDVLNRAGLMGRTRVVNLYGNEARQIYVKMKA